MRTKRACVKVPMAVMTISEEDVRCDGWWWWWRRGGERERLAHESTSSFVKREEENGTEMKREDENGTETSDRTWRKGEKEGKGEPFFSPKVIIVVDIPVTRRGGRKWKEGGRRQRQNRKKPILWKIGKFGPLRKSKNVGKRRGKRRWRLDGLSSIKAALGRWW